LVQYLNVLIGMFVTTLRVNLRSNLVMSLNLVVDILACS